MNSKETFEVEYGFDFFGITGWMCDGWCGETAEEAVAEYLIHNGRDPHDFSKNQIVDITPPGRR